MSLPLDRRLAAIMFTDIVGYSAIMSADEAKAVAILKEKNSILKQLISNHKGNLVKNMGDGSLSYFNSAVDAVRCAKDLQESLQKENKIKIRVGIHLGDIFLENNDIFGDGVNIASRLESMAIEGSILISKEVRDQLLNHAEFEAVSLGLQSLKGVGRLIEVYGIKGKHLTAPDRDNYKNNLIQTHKKDDGVPSIAIIPFENKGKDEDIFYSYGISAGIIKECSQAGMIRVESLNNVEKIENYANLPARNLADTLSVKYIVTGSLWKLDSIFQLSIEVYDSEESMVVWSDHFEEDWKNLSSIKTKLSEGVLKTLSKDSTPPSDINRIDSIAYEYYLKAKYSYFKRQNSEDTEIVRSMYKKAFKLDPKLINAKLGLGETYLETGNYNKAKKIFKESINIAEELNDLNSKATAFDGIGNIHWHKGDYDKSLENLYISLDIMQELNNQSGIAKSLHHIGHNYYYKGKYDKASGYYTRSIEIIEKLGDRNGMGHALLSLGNIYEVKNNLDKALSCYEEAYLINKEFNDKYAAGYAQMGIGNVYTEFARYDEAIEYYNLALDTRIEIEDKNGIAHLHHNIGVIYEKMHNYSDALKSFRKASNLMNELGDKYASSASLKHIGEIHRVMGDYKKSIKVHNESLELRKSMKQNDHIVESLNSLGLTYYLNNDSENAKLFLDEVNKIKYQDEEQALINELYLALVSKELNTDFDLDKIINQMEAIESLNYEIYYFIYKVGGDSAYLRLARESLGKLQDSNNSSVFFSYPIPQEILKENN